MKINKIYINAFGALKDFTLDFSHGLQVVYGENEAGKTTICEFIKAMFYGTGKRAAGKEKSIREKYTPWDGTAASGRVFFEYGGRDFCIERQFRKSDATDKVTITDIAAGKSEACPPDIGKTLFGISVGAFMRSVFIGNSPAFSPDDETGGEINQKLSNAALTGEDSVSLSRVIKRIDDARFNLISKSGRTGSQVADLSECKELTERLNAADTAAHKKQELSQNLDIVNNKLQSIEKECEEVGGLLSRAKDIENAQKLKEYTELKDELDKLTERLTLSDGTVADEMFLKKLEFGFSKLDNMSERISLKEKELEDLKSAAKNRDSSSPDEIKENISKAQAEKDRLQKNAGDKKLNIEAMEKEAEELRAQTENAANTKKAVNPVLLSLGILFLICGAAAYIAVKSAVACAAICGLGVLALVLAFLLKPSAKSAQEKMEKLLNEKQSEINSAKAELMMLSSEINNIDAKLNNLNTSLNFGINEENRIKETEEKISDEKQLLKLEREKVLKFFSLPENTDIEKLKSETSALSDLAEEQKKIKLRLSYLSRDLGGVSYAEAKEKLLRAVDDVDFDIEEKREQAKKLLEEKAALTESKTRIETELQTAFKGMDDPEDLRRKIEWLRGRAKAKQEYFDAASIAREVLEESFIEARKSFGGTLENQVLDNFKKLTGDAYGAVTVSREFDVLAEKNGIFGMHEIEFLSRGTKDQAYLALRLAISKLITEKEPLPVILDDSLSQYDDKRFELALEFLKDYGKDTQILLFTCHNFVTDSAEKSDINIIRI